MMKSTSLRFDWWGSGVIYTDLPVTGGVPQVPFIGCKLHMVSITEQDAALAVGDVDWYSAYYDSVWNLFATHPEISGLVWRLCALPPRGHTFSHVRFQPDVISIQPDSFRQALAEAVNYTGASEDSASGYYPHLPLGYASPSVPTLAGIYNASIYTLPMPGVSTPGITLNIPATGNTSAAFSRSSANTAPSWVTAAGTSQTAVRRLQITCSGTRPFTKALPLSRWLVPRGLNPSP